MGFFSKLKEKVFGKSNARNDKYVAAMDKSRNNFSTKLNNYKSPLDASLSDEGIDEEVYTNLIETVHKNFSFFIL